ncbi:phospholipase A [Aliikangiella sp. IMCC44653]
MKQSHFALLIVLVGINASITIAEESQTSHQACLLSAIQSDANNSSQVSDIKALCSDKSGINKPSDDPNSETAQNMSPLEQRIKKEKNQLDNPNVITPHRRNYMMPITFMKKPNNEPFIGSSFDGKLENLESKFQLSFKAPLYKSLLKEDDLIFFGFTLQSYWQMYNSEISSPFRETNYQPEVFYGFLNDFKVGRWTNRVNIIGIEHQSNGRSQPRSRSWNRVYANFIWENDRWIIGFKPWYRIPEKTKVTPQQADGDDNPDIEKYMGHFEFSSAYKWNEQTFGIMLRNNLRSENRGAIQIDWTFSLGSRYKGYAQYFNGYGESLIDYNQSVERFGVGVMLTDLF